MIIILSILFSIDIFASDPPCKYWQTKVKSHPVKEHKRKSSKIDATHRKTHCRNKWKSANKWVPLFSNSSPDLWPNSKEMFKKWKQSEKELVLKIIGSLPKYLRDITLDSIHRANLSQVKDNSASNLPKPKTLVLYDLFFMNKNPQQVLIHELAHYLFDTLTKTQQEKFAYLSGWKFKKSQSIFSKKKTQFTPPKKLIKTDSYTTIGEDFSNYFEYYLSDSQKIKKFNPQVYQFLKEHFK